MIGKAKALLARLTRRPLPQEEEEPRHLAFQHVYSTPATRAFEQPQSIAKSLQSSTLYHTDSVS